MSSETLEILLVDDNEDHVELIRRAFVADDKAYNFSAVSSLGEARKLLKETTPALMIVDYRLPDGDGTELLPGSVEKLAFPIIVMTGQGDEQVAAASLKSGALDYIVKSDEAFSDMPHIVERTLRDWRHIVERRQAEEALVRSERRYRELYENSPLGYQSLGADGCIIESNPSLCRMLGYEREEVIGKWFGDFLTPESAEKFRARFPEFKAKGVVHAVPFDMAAKDGHKFPVEIDGRIGYDEKGCFKQTHCVILDVSERHKAEDALHNSEESLRNLVEADVNALVVHRDFRLVYINPAARKLFEVPECAAVPEVNVLDYVHPDYRNFTKLSTRRMLRTNKSPGVASILMVTPSGRQLDVEITSTLIMFEGQQTVLSVIRDVTGQKKAEAKIRTLSSSVEQASESIVITDKEGVIEYVNPAFSRITGYSEVEALGQNPRILNSGEHDVAFYEHMWDVLLSGNAWQGRIIDKKKDGNLYPALLTISPIVEESGEISHFVGVQQSLSEHEELEQQLHQAQKMEALGTLVGGIAHDFNNMLAGMVGNLYMAKKMSRDNPDVIQKLTNVEQLSRRAADMIQQLLTFARKDRVSMKPLLLTPFIKETIKFLKPSVPENITLHQDICTDALQIRGDGTQLNQVLLNLVGNARDALESVENPCIIVRLEAFRADEAFVKSRASFSTGDYAHLSVEDNGCGIPQHQIKHLFEPFFTTKEQGKGTGLGLAMVFGAVKTHGGFVEVDSIEGKGSRFHIYIPLLEEEEREVDPEPKAGIAAEGNGELILLVDDQEHIVETGQEVLESLGYRVLTAGDGQRAVEVFEAHREDIELVILDIVMPVMSGVRAAQQIRRISPQARIIFSTGYDRALQADMEQEIVLNKPFTIEKLSQLIQQQLKG